MSNQSKTSTSSNAFKYSKFDILTLRSVKVKNCVLWKNVEVFKDAIYRQNLPSLSYEGFDALNTLCVL